MGEVAVIPAPIFIGFIIPASLSPSRVVPSGDTQRFSLDSHEVADNDHHCSESSDRAWIDHGVSARGYMAFYIFWT